MFPKWRASLVSLWPLHGLQIDAIFIGSHEVKVSCEDNGLVCVSGNAFGQRLHGGYAVM